MLDWILKFIEKFEYLGIFLLMLLENIFPPIPSELILPISGLSVANGELDPIFVLISASLGSICGALFWYFIGKWIGKSRLENFFEKYGHWLAITKKDFSKTYNYFEKNSGKAVFIGRMIPAFRTLISIPAGIVNMQLGRFLMFTTLGTLIWSGLLIYAGYALKDQYMEVSGYVGAATNVIFVFLVIVYIYKVFRFRK